MAEKGNMSKDDIFGTFNMGIGMVVVVSKEDVNGAIAVLNKAGQEAHIIGEVVEGAKQVIL